VALVLVVEDEAQVLVMVDSILADAGYQTLTAGTFAEAMAIIQSDKEIDLLFTDLTLFGKSKAACSSVGHSQRHARKRLCSIRPHAASPMARLKCSSNHMASPR
jgi:DNA-binding NtrC family response regulator